MFNLYNVVIIREETVLGMEMSIFTSGGPQIHLRPTYLRPATLC